MRYNIIKCLIPIIHIDTFGIIEFYKHNKLEVKNEKIVELFDLLKKLVYEKKVICPIAYQEQEIYESVADSMSNFSLLSYGIRFIESTEIQLIQLNQILNNVRDENLLLNISYNDAFDEDVIHQIEKVDKFILSVAYEPDKKELREREETKIKNMTELNVFKASEFNLKEFEKQLEIEYLGTYQASKFALENYIKKYSSKTQVTLTEVNQYTNLFARPYEVFRSVLGTDKTINDFFDFLKSDIHREIPYIDINVKMIADIVVSNKSFESGDSVDITNASALLPYCNFFITDRKQKNRIKKFELDSKYNTSIYSFTQNDIVDFIDTLKKL